MANLKFTITVSGQRKHIDYTDQLDKGNSEPAWLDDGESEVFKAKKAGDGKGRAMVLVGLTEDGDHNEAIQCATPSDGDEFEITDDDLP
jgi:hypothetical protein